MKKISIKKVKDTLQKNNTDDLQIELIINNISLYNDLITSYKADKKNAYILYQLNLQIFKMIQSIQKTGNIEPVENDSFTQMINEIKNNSMVLKK